MFSVFEPFSKLGNEYLKFTVVKNSISFCLLGVKPLYAEISEWRKILSRLCSFLRSVDYLILEMLRRLVLTAVRQLLDHLVTSYNITDEDEEKVLRTEDVLL